MVSASRPLALGLLTVFGVAALSGCLGGGSPEADPNDLIGGVLANLVPACDVAPKDVLNASTGRIENPCNVALTTGPQPVNEPSIAINPTNPLNMIAGGNDYNLGNTVWTGVYTTFDGGTTWTQSWIPGYPGGPPGALTGQTAAGDAAIAFAPDGTAYYAGIAFKRTNFGAGSRTLGEVDVQVFEGPSLFIARSSDGGASWDHVAVPELGVGPLIVVSNPVSPQALAATLFNDKEYIAAGPDGEIYVTWTRFVFSPALNEAPIAFIKSTDRGQTWTDPVVISPTDDNQGSVPVVMPDGTVVVTWGEFPNDEDAREMNVVVRTSNDGGQSWNEAVVVDNIRAIVPSHGARVNSFPVISVDASKGPNADRLHLTWAADEHGDADVYHASSDDAGSTWTEPVRVNQDAVGNGRAQFFPWIATGPNGTTHIVYYDTRDDPRNQHIATYVASTIDGANWTEQAVTDAPFLADQDGFDGQNFLGDYLGIAASEHGVFPVWPDTRTGNAGDGNTDLFTLRLTAEADAGTPARDQ